MQPIKRKRPSKKQRLKRSRKTAPALTAKPYARQDYNTTTVVAVGPASCNKQFTVHSDLLKEHSTVFRAALEGVWAEAHSNRVELPEDDINAFQVFVHWLYSQKVECSQVVSDMRFEATCMVDEAEDPITREANTCYSILIKAYVLGDKRGARRFCNNVLDTLVSTYLRLDTLPWFNEIKYAYENLPRGSRLQRLLIDLWVWEAPADTLTSMVEETVLTDFFGDCFKAHVDATHNYGIKKHGYLPDDYHEHGQDEKVPCGPFEEARLYNDESERLSDGEESTRGTA